MTVANATHALNSGGSADAFETGLEKALGQFVDAYGNATGVPCRATVQITYKPPDQLSRGDLAVKTVSRSATRAGQKSHHSTDWINENTDFRQILKEDREHFFSNDLKAALAQGYRNSHFTDEVIKDGTFPYLATIVWPVRGRTAGSSIDQWDLIGFLCIDSGHSGAFDEAVDVAPGIAFSHALYSGLLKYRNDQTEVGS